MASYTITVAPNDGSGASTTLTVEATAEHVRVTDVHLHATDGLADGTLPVVDFGLLLRAIAAPSRAVTATPVAATPVTATPVTATPVARGVAAVPVAAANGKAPRAKATAVKPTGSRRSKTATKPAAPTGSRKATRATTADAAHATTKASTSRGGRLATNAATAAARTKSAAATTQPSTGSGRAYRRMPDDFPAVYQRTGSPTTVAEHYRVPRHTVQGWIRRHRANQEATS